MCSKCLTRGLAVVPVVALAVGVAALGTAALAGGSDVAAPAVNLTAAAPAAAEPGLAPTTTSRDWQETAGSVSRVPVGRF